ncbi:MAG: hypothetical protein B7Y89_01780 [Novosphingobium sp. 32-60-15]|uniref:Rap1a/Tai family immunity protein n=1 Tax=unclassified Novosphingobium TaxID=2644732 RepID=UPI000BDCF494|nr:MULTISPECIES: Rap1a/Tai family immunity protein [unclassified Novosphingobium]OYX64370.1 MAG: hypothetical protein B7Y89_01780 [Novosphingobium sp. 32-60-15]
MPKTRLRLTLVASLAALSTPAHAEWMDGNQLHDTCATPAPLDRAMCLSYVIGVLDGLRYLPQPPVTPKGATAGQVRDVVAKYLIDHPEMRDQQARILVRAAVASAWPELQPKPAQKPKPRIKKR